MDYETFRAIWNDALRRSRLPTIGLHAKEALDTRSLNREYEVYVEPLGGQHAEPFHVAAMLSWSWHALNTCRATTSDEDVLTEMLGRDLAQNLEAKKACVRVDIKLHASAPYGNPLPMPPRNRWGDWVRETVQRLDHIEPLLADEIFRQNEIGQTEVLGWQDSPKAVIVCAAEGDLLLEAVEISAFQIVELVGPREIEDPALGETTEFELIELFQRVRASLSAWMQAVNHLRPRSEPK
jgi:hypothetical protein